MFQDNVASHLPPIGSSKAKYMSPRHTKKYNGLDGPVYTLHGKDPCYGLPSPNTVKPHQDTKAGTLDTWPAHAGTTYGTTSIAMTRNKELVLVNDEAMGKPRLVPKPKFLDQLDGFLQKELRKLDVSDVGPSELRLQAYREAFEYLIEDFKTYKPLLAAIKNEYEMMLANQREQIRQMEPLKQMLVTVSEQCDQKIMALRDKEAQEYLELKTTNKRLHARIEDLTIKSGNLEAQVEKLQEELAAEYLRYRDECDSRKLLVADINELRYQQEDLVATKQSAQDMEDEHGDPVTLRIALKKAREDEAAATARLNQMIANYGDVIPRRDFEALQKQHEALKAKWEHSGQDYKKLHEEHLVLQDVHKQVLQQRDDFFVECETLRRNKTPRPDWSRCADYIDGGALRWMALSENKTSDQLVGVLLNEISGTADKDSAGAEFFEGMGFGPEVPAFLQFEGKVRNRRLGKRDCGLLIKDIWREKIAHDAQRWTQEEEDRHPYLFQTVHPHKVDSGREKMSEFLVFYLKRKFGLEQMIIEWAYNLNDACKRYAHDEKIGFFKKVLNGEADEEVYHHNLHVISKLHKHLTKADVDQGNHGVITKEEFALALREFFADRSAEDVASILKAAEDELEAKDMEFIEYKNLFLEDDEGQVGPFLELVGKKVTEGKLQYINEIKEALGTANPVTTGELKMAIATTDQEIDGEGIDRYLCWAFNTESDKLQECEAIDREVLIERLRNGNIHRHEAK